MSAEIRQIANRIEQLHASPQPEGARLTWREAQAGMLLSRAIDLGAFGWSRNLHKLRDYEQTPGIGSDGFWILVRQDWLHNSTREYSFDKDSSQIAALLRQEADRIDGGGRVRDPQEKNERVKGYLCAKSSLLIQWKGLRKSGADAEARNLWGEHFTAERIADETLLKLSTVKLTEAFRELNRAARRGDVPRWALATTGNPPTEEEQMGYGGES